ncbi:MAG: type II toxin-antitoxin system VapC family toxin [Acidobacteria bacterium]|nr:type II toxin-antitoxin system VapC family toxin [Acidobacteriota bacterium]
MIVLDTHVWIWWVHGDPLLPSDVAQVVAAHEATGLGISAISCWEIAKLVEYNRLQLPLPINDWMAQALAYPGIVLLELSPEIAIDSTQLPPPFHKDPADQMIVATARIHNVPLVTCDHKIRAYPHVQLLP